MKAILVLAILTLGQAAELAKTTEATTTNTAGKPQAQTELPVHIQNLITSHINQVLQHVKDKPSNTLTGPVDGSWSGSGSGSDAPVVKPYPDLLPPFAHSGDVRPVANVDRPASASAVQSGLQPVQAGHPQVRVTNHQAIGTLIHQGRPVVQNKVVWPPVGQVVLTPPGQQPIDVAEKLHKLQQHVTKVMQMAEKHIPLALQQAIQKRKEQREQREKEELQKEKVELQKEKEEVQKEEKLEKEKEKEAQLEQKDQEKPKDPEHNPGKTGRSLVINPNVSNQVHAHIPQLMAQHREEIKLGKCNFECPRQALNICASNGKCVVKFPGQCELSQWNCFNAKNVFHQVHDAECQNTITCYQRDMM